MNCQLPAKLATELDGGVGAEVGTELLALELALALQPVTYAMLDNPPRSNRSVGNHPRYL